MNLDTSALRYRVLVSLCIIFMLTVSAIVNVSYAETGASSNRNQAETVYQDSTLNEDVSWRGNILVKGYLVIAPQATLRIEPGTVVRFTSGSDSRQLPRLVIMGRVQAVGTGERPIQFVSRQNNPTKSSWGGILLLSSEKRNQFEHCRIEGSQAAIEARFSSISVKNVTVINSTGGIILNDSIATIVGATITSCNTGLESSDSELDLKDSTISHNLTGMALDRSSIIMSSVSVTRNTQKAISGNDCRIRMNSCDVSDNAVGADIKGGEGQLLMSRFMRNRDTALHITAARLKIHRCRISDNARNGLSLEDGRATIWGSDISNNGELNLVYSGRERVSAVRNWWGTADESALMAKIKSGNSDARSSLLHVYPWLTEKPAVLP
jgi:hypothetical protein